MTRQNYRLKWDTPGAEGGGQQGVCYNVGLMEGFWTTLGSILVVELTDKTRLVAMVLSARYRAPLQLIFGMTLGYVFPIAVAIFGAEVITQFVPGPVLRWGVAISFFAFGLYVILSREGKRGQAKRDDSPFCLSPFSSEKAPGWIQGILRLGPFWVGMIWVSVTEFLDKSQLATAGLAMKYGLPLPVFLGSLSAQGILNILYVAAGHHLGKRLPERLIRWVAGLTFVAFGVAVLFR